MPKQVYKIEIKLQCTIAKSFLLHLSYPNYPKWLTSQYFLPDVQCHQIFPFQHYRKYMQKKEWLSNTNSAQLSATVKNPYIDRDTELQQL